MSTFFSKLSKKEFEGRIFVSFGIVAIVGGLAYATAEIFPNNAVIIGGWLGFQPEVSLKTGFFIAAILMTVASILRIWAGSVLTSDRMMAFSVQCDALITKGPYNIVRNPIYLADLIAFCGFSLCLNTLGLLLPVAQYLHYLSIIRYEERSLTKNFSNDCDSYLQQTPRILPPIYKPLKIFCSLKQFQITKDGIRHNALYLLFIPGFIVSSFTGNLLHALLLGLPAVIDWTIVHIRIGKSATRSFSGGGL